MLTIIHGSHTENARNEYNKLKASYPPGSVRTVDGKTTDESALRQALESSSLFGEEVVVAIENLLTPLGKKTNLQKAYAKILNDNTSATIILWEPKELTKTVLGLFSNFTDLHFPIPKVLFTFLDAIRPHNERQLLTLYHQLHTTEASELIYYMISTRIRQLIAVKSNAMLPSMNSWQASRLTNQAKFFTMEQLMNMHSDILMQEFAFKTGVTPFTLSQCIEHILIGLS